MKKVLSVILSLVLVLSVFTIAPSMANAGKTGLAETGADSGATGDCTWTLDDNGVLTISGNGKMGDYDQDAPWGTDIKKVVIENGVTRIGEMAFDECKGLTSVMIGNSVTSIGWYAFEDCTGLKSITIPDSVTSIGWGAFVGCTGLTSITVSKGNAVYDSRNNCNAIIETKTNELIVGSNNTVIPDSVTRIGSSAFFGCSGLTSVTIPDSVKSIGDWAFSDCTGLTNITVSKGNAVYDSRNNCNAIIETETNELIVGCKSTVIPNSVTSIGYYAFSGCTGLTSVTIPDSVTSIGDSAFERCTGLTSVTIPNSVWSIGEYAFCTGLTSVTIPDSVWDIGYHAFGYFYDSNQDIYVKVNDFTIYGNKGTAAEEYADYNDFTFVPLGEMPTDAPTETPTDAPTEAPTDAPTEAPTDGPAQVICGDADGDGEVTVLDATRVQRWIADLCDINGEAYTGAALTANELKAADADSDGEVTILDATAIQRHIADLPTNEDIGKTVE